MSGASSDVEFLAAQMADHETSWSLGTFGAIAEFARDPDEPVVLSRDNAGLAAVTARGAIRIEACEHVRLFASETTTRESWSQRVALCLPRSFCAMNGRSVLTALGPDVGALREEDRRGTLFDLGLGALQMDACIRVGDPGVAARLGSHCGRALFEPGNEAMQVILAAGPHRVFASRLGRIEVFAPIPPADGRSPNGPHTHVLPKLLRHRRTHAATEPIPDGFVPCAHLYPAHPARDASGRSRPFEPGRHAAFQDILRRFGDPASVALKQRLIAAIAAGTDPSAMEVGNGRFAGASIRVVLRQLGAAEEASPVLAAWRAVHERSDRIDRERADDPDGHG
ncbi:MAG: hypothetical protein WBW74_10195 [Xanthobacteraceae bacterium]